MLQPAAVWTQCIALQIQQQQQPYEWIWMSLVLSLSNRPQVGNKRGGTCLRLAVFVQTVTGFYRKERPDGNIKLVITHTAQQTNLLRSGDECLFCKLTKQSHALCHLFNLLFFWVFFFIINCCSILGLLISRTIIFTLNNKFMLYFFIFFLHEIPHSFLMRIQMNTSKGKKKKGQTKKSTRNKWKSN